MSAVSEAIKQAKEAAANIVDDAEVSQETLPAVASGTGTVLNYGKPSMAQLASNVRISNLVETWIKVSQHGITIGQESKPLFESIKLSIDMTEGKGFFVKESIKYGNPIQYASRYDGALSDKGEPWADVVARAQRMDPKAKVYPSADLILTLREPLKLKDKTLPEGTKLGHTLAMTNWENWAEFFRECMSAGYLDGEVAFTLGYDEVNGKNGYTWGVLNFTLD